MARTAASGSTGRTRPRGPATPGPRPGAGQERGASSARRLPGDPGNEVGLTGPGGLARGAVDPRKKAKKKVSRATDPGGTRGTAPDGGGLLRIRARARRPQDEADLHGGT